MFGSGFIATRHKQYVTHQNVNVNRSLLQFNVKKFCMWREVGYLLYVKVILRSSCPWHGLDSRNIILIVNYSWKSGCSRTKVLYLLCGKRENSDIGRLFTSYAGMENVFFSIFFLLTLPRCPSMYSSQTRSCSYAIRLCF